MQAKILPKTPFAAIKGYRYYSTATTTASQLHIRSAFSEYSVSKYGDKKNATSKEYHFRGFLSSICLSGSTMPLLEMQTTI